MIKVIAQYTKSNAITVLIIALYFSKILWNTLPKTAQVNVPAHPNTVINNVNLPITNAES